MQQTFCRSTFPIVLLLALVILMKDLLLQLALCRIPESRESETYSPIASPLGSDWLAGPP